MRVSVAREELLNSLIVVSKGLSSRTTLPILSGIHITAQDDHVVLQTTDLEVSIRTLCKAKVELPGQSVIPGKLLIDVIRSLPDAAVNIDTTTAGLAEIQCHQSSFRMKTLSAEDYPKFPSIQANTAVSVPGQTFSQVVRQVSRSVSRDETRPILTGVLLEIKDDILRMVSTDSYRLCIREITMGGLESDLNIVVPGKSLEDVAKLITEDQPILIGVSENQVIFKFDETEFISRRIEGSFPNYNQLLPKEYSTKVVVGRLELFEAVKRVSLMAQHSTPIRIKVISEENIIKLSSSAQEMGEAIENINADIDGEDVEIAFNYVYLLDGVSSAEGDSISIEICSPLKPGVLKMINDQGFVYLLMPVRIG